MHFIRHRYEPYPSAIRIRVGYRFLEKASLRFFTVNGYRVNSSSSFLSGSANPLIDHIVLERGEKVCPHPAPLGFGAFKPPMLEKMEQEALRDILSVMGGFAPSSYENIKRVPIGAAEL